MADSIKIDADLQIDEESFSPDIGRDITYGTGYINQGFEYTVAASAADALLDLSKYGDVQQVAIVAPVAASTNITVKSNSTGATGYRVSPIREISQQVTTLYFTNAIATAYKVKVFIGAIES